MTDTSVSQTTAAPATTERALFDKAMAKHAPGFQGGVSKEQSATATAPKPVKTSSPERIWEEGRAARRAAEERNAPAEPVKPEKPQAEVEPQATPAGEEEDLEAERAALRSLGFRKKHLDTMDADEIRARGAKAIKRIEADAEAHRIAKEWREAQRAKGQTDESKPDSQPARKKLDLKPLVGKLKDTLALDDAGAETLRETFEQFAGMVSESTAAPLREELTKFQQAQVAKSHQEMLDRAQAEIGKRIPDLLDPDTFAEVTREAVAISGSKQFERFKHPQERAAACIEVAAINLGYMESESASKSVERATRRDARPTIGDKSRPTTPTTQREADWLAYRAAMQKHGM